MRLRADMTMQLSFGKNVAACNETEKFSLAKRMVETFAPLTSSKFPVHKVGLRVPQFSGPSVVCTSEDNWRTASVNYNIDNSIEIVVLAPNGHTIQILTRVDLEGSCNTIPIVAATTMRKLGDAVIDLNRPPTLTELEDLITDAVSVVPQKLYYQTNPTERIPIEGGADIAAFCADAVAFRESISIIVDCTVLQVPSAPAVKTASTTSVEVSRTAKCAAPTRTKAPPPAEAAAPMPPPASESGAEFVSISFQCNPPVITLVGDIEQSELSNMSEQILEKCIGARAALYKTRPAFESLGIVGGQPAYRLELSRASFDDVHEMQMILVCLDTMDKFEQYRVVPMDGLTDIQKTLHQTASERNRTALTLGSTKPAPILQPGVPAKRFVEFFFIAKSH